MVSARYQLDWSLVVAANLVDVAVQFFGVAVKRADVAALSGYSGFELRQEHLCLVGVEYGLVFLQPNDHRVAKLESVGYVDDAGSSPTLFRNGANEDMRVLDVLELLADGLIVVFVGHGRLPFWCCHCCM